MCGGLNTSGAPGTNNLVTQTGPPPNTKEWSQQPARHACHKALFHTRAALHAGTAVTGALLCFRSEKANNTVCKTPCKDTAARLHKPGTKLGLPCAMAHMLRLLISQTVAIQSARG
eukprot:2717410-Lingulodinium_polyedra.AAC.1